MAGGKSWFKVSGFNLTREIIIELNARDYFKI